MAASLNVSVDLSHLLNIGPVMRAHIFSNLAGAVQGIAAAGEERWQRAALKAPLWEGERQAYAASISHRMTGEFSAEIVSDYKYVEDIESGRPAYDMKRMLWTSTKVRTGKKGRYLIIPFRHNTPGHTAHAGDMTAEVYASARKLTPSRIVGGGMRLAANGVHDIKSRSPAFVPMRKYAWGDRLPAGLVPKLASHHKSDPTAGMVRMDTSSGKQKSSAYMTFRVMAEWSSGWIKPATPGLYIAKAVAESLQRTADKDFPAAIARDLG
jgi:hypothetical protein